MNRFFRKATLILLPILFTSLCLVGLAWHTGEALPIEIVVNQQQSNEGIIYGTRQIEDILSYKLASYEWRQPDILILGSSRLLQFRSEFFNNDPGAVYNASGGGWRLPQFIEFYEQLDSLPSIIILGVDSFLFNADMNLSARTVPIETPGYSLDSIRLATIEIVHTLLSGALTLEEMADRRDPVFGRLSIGLKAIEISFGFRADGSLQKGRLVASPALAEYDVQRDIASFMGMGHSYTPGSRLNYTAFELLDSFLERLYADGVAIIGVTPPYHFNIVEKMQESGAYKYIDLAIPRLKSLFAQNGFPYYSFDDMRKLGADSSEWYDGHHPTESNSLRMLLVLFEDNPEIFDKYADLAKVRAILKNSSNPMDVLRELP